MGAIYTGVSGMQACQVAVDVIANNVANINTTAYKAGRATFEEMVERTLSGGTADMNPQQIGLGVTVGSIDLNMTPGVLQPTGRPLDLAIAGEGYFVLSDGSHQYYTRDGAMHLNPENTLLASNGMKVLGWQASQPTGVVNATTEPTLLTIPVGSSSATATSKVIMGGNLCSADTTGTANATVTVYDSLGTAHEVDLAFARTTPNTWTWVASVADGTLVSPDNTGVITFDTNGHVTSGSEQITFDVTPANGAGQVIFQLDLAKVTQLDGESSIQADSQDGMKMGTLSSYSIDEQGIITGIYDNGANSIIGQLAIATFANPGGLMNHGGNLWIASPSSGSSTIHQPDGGSSKIRSGFTELSNVDLANEFANLIVTQRAFQANSRSITTADEMMQDLLQLKR